MKNQYFADKRDFYKYDLLLHLMGCGLGFEQLLMGWWLTPDDASTDGEVRDYKVGRRDQALHDWLQAQHHRTHRDVRRLADFAGVATAPWRSTPILDLVPYRPEERELYVDRIVDLAGAPNLISLDPDNGMMAKSVTAGRRDKYVDYPELGRMVDAMHDDSLLVVFQYLPRMARDVFYPAALQRLREDAGAKHVTWLSPDNLVAYFVVAASDERLSESVSSLDPYFSAHRFQVLDGGGA